MTQTDTYGWASENWSSPRSEANPCCQKLNLGDLSSSSACNGTVEDERKFYEWIERCVEARDTKYD